MKVNGYKLREAIRRWQLRRDTASGQFPKVINKFPNEDKPHPETVGAAALKAEFVLAALQTAQAQYNSRVFVPYAGQEWSLTRCIKTVGGLGRIEKMWRTAATVEKDRYSYGAETRDASHVVAARVISYDEAGKIAAEFGAQLGALREAIATGNARDVEITDLDPALLE